MFSSDRLSKFILAGLDQVIGRKLLHQHCVTSVTLLTFCDESDINIISSKAGLTIEEKLLLKQWVSKNKDASLENATGINAMLTGQSLRNGVTCEILEFIFSLSFNFNYTETSSQNYRIGFRNEKQQQPYRKFMIS